MNEKLFRTQFNQMETTEKQALMESLAARYDMTFLGLHTFDRWGQSCTTGIFEKDGREFVFVPGDTVTLGWEQFAVGLNQESREELEEAYPTFQDAFVDYMSEYDHGPTFPIGGLGDGSIVFIDLESGRVRGYNCDYADLEEIAENFSSLLLGLVEQALELGYLCKEL